MTISGDPAQGGSYNLASAGPDEPTVNVGFDVSPAFVGFVYGIVLVPPRFGDASACTRKKPKNSPSGALDT